MTRCGVWIHTLGSEAGQRSNTTTGKRQFHGVESSLARTRLFEVLICTGQLRREWRSTSFGTSTIMRCSPARENNRTWFPKNRGIFPIPKACRIGAALCLPVDNRSRPSSRRCPLAGCSFRLQGGHGRARTFHVRRYPNTGFLEVRFGDAAPVGIFGNRVILNDGVSAAAVFLRAFAASGHKHSGSETCY